ncbi:7470_t:CDS:2 [Funneliformis caledonium]|uniref:1-acyl-sn-glycerol-3-phosphate acyltransferase n=1 Tax=Funneliformis caledonium TaxID=1117310 RepID=A0A9N9DTN3_9GLOM|nr:7470_t:CDS:2 [Funneliformis caledonium]
MFEVMPIQPLYITMIIGAIYTGSRINKKIQFGVRGIISLIFLLIFSAYGSFIAVLFSLIGKRGLINYVTARSYGFFAIPAVGISFKVHGEENLNVQPAVYICNHQAAIDVLVLARIFPKHCVVVGKASLRFVPLLGMFTVFLDRKNHGSAVQALTKAADDIREQKISVFIFPEGTRARLQEADLLPFKKGAFHMAVQAKIPVVPIVVANYSDNYDSKRKIFLGGEINIKVLPPIEVSHIDVENKEQIDELTNSTRELMLKTLKEISPRKYSTKK